MRGLFYKDWRLLLQRKGTFLIIMIFGVFCVVSGQNMAFAVSMSGFVAAEMAVTTITYDDMENGLACIFTWPTSRAQYVFEKYLFAGIVGGCGWLFATLFGLYAVFSGLVVIPITQWLLECLVVLFNLVVILCIVIPLLLKFGAEKARTVLLCTMFGMFGIIGLLSFAGVGMPSGVQAALFEIPAVAYAVAAVAVVLASLAVSVRMSIRIVEKKEL